MPVELTDYAKNRRHEGLATGKIKPDTRKFSRRTEKPKKSVGAKMKAHKDGAAAARKAADKALGITRR